MPGREDFRDLFQLLIFTISALDNADNFSEICNEIMRVLKPGGEFIASFNLEEQVLPSELQQLNEKIIKDNLLNYLEVQSCRITEKGPSDNCYAPLFNGNLSYEPVQKGFLWSRARMPI